MLNVHNEFKHSLDLLDTLASTDVKAKTSLKNRDRGIRMISF